MVDPEPSPSFSRLPPRWLLGADAVAALVYTALVLPTAVSEGHSPGLAVPLVLAVGLPVAVRRRWPRPVLAVVAVASVAGMATGVVEDPFVAATLATYTVALDEPRRRWVPTRTLGVAGAAFVVFAAAVGPVGWRWDEGASVLLGAAIVAAAWALGRAVRDRRAYTEHAARQLARRAVTDERLRIARELHDVVAHSMSLITVKAGVAHHVAHERPDEAADALGVIETTGRTALSEMRSLLHLLRTDETPAGASPDLAPAPGLADLPALVDRARMAGVQVDLRVEDGGDLPEGVDLCAYRIVQEALTNVVRHAAPAGCTVRIATADGTLAIDVRDDGPGVRVLPDSPADVGHGLIGMSERVAAFGGEFSAGPEPAGGFSVSARLPYRTADAGSPA
ncbi:sensor histidine kinase [Haloactinopolyspora alba]|uniref:sensor histidine kinase n=1 Tax=Haloactinopolyspora alba TaxID=648780 RepID=UPI00197AB55A|nr:sensor histidine kinase [Haloactinopolyspora alba]